MEADRTTEHHELGPSAFKRAYGTIDKIKAAILSHGNPFTTEDYVSERINGDVSLWAPVKKVNNKMFVYGNKKITVQLRDNTVDLKETKDLFARLMVLARTDSLKSATRDKLRQGKAVQYQVRDDTNIKHIPLSRFLSHDQTKADLTDYLTAKILEYNRGSSKLIITSASGNTRSNKDLLFEENNHEEADTLLIHQAVLASHRNPADAQLMFFSPDTDILVLVTAKL
ncbi:hypothetical protein KUCAC02_001789 [Chaenocephalus aceratus]|uniref:Uncharacterized protein n=1 Tax=Chaenocephalus aceratus TaxID=36190 RepID=A0ACB9XU70_CHAAC|nr:hypothetical protein KUCAC02_001789 [Chaenocephalus aceratus]